MITKQNKPNTSANSFVNDERVGQLYMFCAMVIAGTIGYFVLLSEQSAFNVVFFRCAIGAVGLFLYCWYKGFLRSIKINAPQFANLLLGALTLIFNWYFLFTAYRLTSVGITTVVYNVQPFLLLLAGFIFRKEKPSKMASLWLTAAFVGLIVLAQPTSDQASSAYLLGVGSALAAATLYAFTTLLTKKLSATMRPEVIAVCHMLIGTCAFIPLIDFHNLPKSDTQISAIVALGLFHTTFMYVLLYGAFKKAATGSIAVLGFVYPLVAVLVDFLAYEKMMSYSQLIGGGIILFSTVAYATGFSPSRLSLLLRLKSFRRSSGKD